MAEPEVNLERGNEENVESNEDIQRSSSVLAGLNLVLILSSLSLSDEECPNWEEIEEIERGNCSRRSKNNGSRLNNPLRRREVNEIGAVGRQMAKANTKIRDCRHCRKM